MSRSRSAPPDPDLGKRFSSYLASLFRGNQSLMAENLGCSQALISKIVTGKQLPGQRVLSALARHAKVNPAWLLAGEGEPLLAGRGEAPGDGWPVPVARHILAGPLLDHRRELPGQQIPVPSSLFHSSRYFLEIGQGLSVITDPDEHLRPGDLVLMETEVDGWLSNPASLAGKLVAVWRPKQRSTFLGRSDFLAGSSTEAPELFVRTIGPDGNPCRVRITLATDAVTEIAPPRSPRRSRALVFDEQPLNCGEEIMADDAKSIESEIAKIVGVAVFLWRSF